MACKILARGLQRKRERERKRDAAILKYVHSGASLFFVVSKWQRREKKRGSCTSNRTLKHSSIHLPPIERYAYSKQQILSIGHRFQMWCSIQERKGSEFCSFARKNIIHAINLSCSLYLRNIFSIYYLFIKIYNQFFHWEFSVIFSYWNWKKTCETDVFIPFVYFLRTEDKLLTRR